MYDLVFIGLHHDQLYIVVVVSCKKYFSSVRYCFGQVICTRYQNNTAMYNCWPCTWRTRRGAPSPSSWANPSGTVEKYRYTRLVSVGFGSKEFRGFSFQYLRDFSSSSEGSYTRVQLSNSGNIRSFLQRNLEWGPDGSSGAKWYTVGLKNI